MSDWPTVSLADVAEIRFSNVDKRDIPGEARVRLCNYMDAYANEYITADLPFMEASATQLEIERFRVSKGDVILTKDSETPDDIGIPAVVIDEISNLICGYHLALVKPNRDAIDSVYLAKQLASKPTARYFARLANGSTRYGLSSSAIASTSIPLAPLPQQRSIAEILSTLDEMIEQTEALIAKYQQIKAGLMHDLFTRGVTPDGGLCPTGESQQTKFGRIPRGWRIGSLLEVADAARQPILTGPFGADLGNDDFVAEGVPVLRIGNVQEGRLDLSDLLYVTEAKARDLQRYEVNEGDLLFARQGATTGRNALATPDVQGYLINYHIIRVALDHSRCAPIFVEAAFNGEVVKRQVEREKGRGTREGINTAQLKALELPLAPVPEQRTIAAILMAHRALHADMESQLAKLRQLKHGLMHDLLTGCVRVEAVESTAG